MNNRKHPEDLRSHRWLGEDDLRSFGHRARFRQGGFDAPDWVGKPVIGIINTWSDLNFCHTHLRARAEDVKRGVWQAGGFPVELPAMSLSEPFVKPSTMMAITEALGLSLPGASSIPAADAAHPRMCSNSGRRIVDMVWDDLTPQRILTKAAFDNAIRVHMAMGGSTNAIIHVVAMARRAGLALDMNRFDEISRE